MSILSDEALMSIEQETMADNLGKRPYIIKIQRETAEAQSKHTAKEIFDAFESMAGRNDYSETDYGIYELWISNRKYQELKARFGL